MDTIHHYEIQVKWQAERKGLMSSPVLHSTIEVATPPEFSKGIAGIWSPEIVFDLSPSEIPGLGVYRGHEEVRAFFEADWFGVGAQQEQLSGHHEMNEQAVAVLEAKPEMLAAAIDAGKSFPNDERGKHLLRHAPDNTGKIPKLDRVDRRANHAVCQRAADRFDFGELRHSDW